MRKDLNFMLYLAGLQDPLFLSLIGVNKPVKLNYEKISKIYGRKTASRLKLEIAVSTGS